MKGRKKTTKVIITSIYHTHPHQTKKNGILAIGDGHGWIRLQNPPTPPPKCLHSLTPPYCFFFLSFSPPPPPNPYERLNQSITPSLLHELYPRSKGGFFLHSAFSFSLPLCVLPALSSLLLETHPPFFSPLQSSQKHAPNKRALPTRKNKKKQHKREEERQRERERGRGGGDFVFRCPPHDVFFISTSRTEMSFSSFNIFSRVLITSSSTSAPVMPFVTIGSNTFFKMLAPTPG